MNATSTAPFVRRLPMMKLPEALHFLLWLVLLAFPVACLAQTAQFAWKTPLTGAAVFTAKGEACVAAWQVNQNNPYLCPAGANYCWTSGGPHPTRSLCTAVCSGAGCPYPEYDHCSSTLAGCGYGADLLPSCPAGFEIDRSKGLCVEPSSAKSNGPSACPATSPYPIAYGTGNKWLVENDLSGDGGGLTFSRTYNSNPATLSSALGASWRIEYGERLGFDSASGAVWAYRPDGRALRFVATGGSYVADADIPDRLYTESSGGYRLETGSNVERYDSAGRLTSRTDVRGRTRTFSYDSNNRLTTVMDHAGRALSFSYDSSSRISALTDPAGRRITYAYDSSSNLSTVTFPDLKTKVYHYNEPAQTGGANLPHALTGTTDENGNRYMSYSYDSAGRAVGELSPTVGSDTNRYQLTYGSGSTTVTDPLGSSRTYSFQTILGVPRLTGSSQPAGSGCAAAARAIAYDANGNVSSRTDFGGNITTYSYDTSRNLETQRVEGSGTPNARTITTEWHGVWRLPTRIAEPKKLASYVYNGDLVNGQPVACAPASAVIARGGSNQKIGVLCKLTEQATTDPDGSSGLATPSDTSISQRVWSYTYDVAGRVLSSVDPNGRTTTYAYFADTSFPDYDPLRSQVSLLLHGNGMDGATQFADDGPSSKTLTGQGDVRISTTQSKYGGAAVYFDGAGDYISVVGPLLPASDAFTIEAWVYRAASGLEQAILTHGTIGTAGRTFLYFNAADRVEFFVGGPTNLLLSSAGAVSAAAWHHIAVTRSGSDFKIFVDGALVGSGSSANTIEQTASVRIGKNVDSAPNQRYLTGYLDDLRVTSGAARYAAGFTAPTQELPHGILENAKGHTGGDLQSITNAAGQVTTFNLYDPAGRVRKMTDAKGVVTDITYTPRGWVSTMTVTPPGGAARTTTYTYDNAGQLTGTTQPDGTTVSYTYDAAHRLTGATDSRGNSVAYTLDNTGNRTGEEVRDPGGALQRAITRSFDALNRLQQITGATQ